MTLTWADAEPNSPRDPYVQFAWMLRQRHEPPLGKHIYQPIFVRLHGDDPLAERRELLEEVLDPLSPLLMDPFELELLAARCGPVDPDATPTDVTDFGRRVTMGQLEETMIQRVGFKYKGIRLH